MTYAALLNFTAPHGPAWLFLGVGMAIVLGPIVATRLRLPPIIGLLVGGLVIGPQVFGIVTATDTTVSALGQLGLLYLMFTAGAELDLVLFRRYREAAAKFGLMTFAAPMALGFTGGRLLDYSIPASLLLGSLWASHTLVTYPMVRQAGLSGNRAAATTVGATVITDTLSLVVLAGVAGSVRGDSGLLSIIFSLIVGLVILGIYAAWVLPRASRLFFAGPAHEGPARFAFLLAAMLSCAVLAEVVGIEGIVGAFFAGLGLNRLVPAGSGLMERVEFFGSALLVPVFLMSVGVLIKPSVMVDPSTLGLAAVFCASVIGGKAIAALAARPVLGFTSGESGLMFGMSLSQAAATLAATFVGFDVGLFGEQVVNAVLVVILVTLLIAAVATARAIPHVEPTPSEETELGRILVLAAAREDRLVALARLTRSLVEREGGMVVPFRVTVRPEDAPTDRAFLSLTETVLAKAGLEAEGRLRVDSDPVEAVAATVIEGGGTLLVLDWLAATRHQPALKGGRDDDLLAASPVPVVLAALSDTPVRRVVLTLEAEDLAPESAADVAAAIEVADRVAGGDCERLVLGPDSPGLSTLVAEFDAFVSPSGVPRLDWITHHAQAGDLVVIPALPAWDGFGPAAVAASTRAGVSALVVADPQRWTGRVAPVEHGFGSVLHRTAEATHRWG